MKPTYLANLCSKIINYIKIPLKIRLFFKLYFFIFKNLIIPTYHISDQSAPRWSGRSRILLSQKVPMWANLYLKNSKYGLHYVR